MVAWMECYSSTSYSIDSIAGLARKMTATFAATTTTSTTTTT